jgi:hypothetical protein
LFADDLLEFVERFEFLKNGGEADVGDLILGGEDVEDGVADLARGNGVGAELIDGIYDFVDDRLNLEVRIEEFADGATDSREEFVALKRLTGARGLNYLEGRALDTLISGKAEFAVRRDATTTDHGAVGSFAGFKNATIADF